MTDHLLQSTSLFQQYFTHRLSQLLDYDELGVFILVLANASMNERILSRLAPLIDKKFRALQQQLKHAPGHPEDDLTVFKQLEDLGLKNIQQTRSRSLGPWHVSYNQLRALRPARHSHRAVSSLQQPFDKNAFHFNKPFLQREIIWCGQIQAMDITLFYNKFPFADYHALLLIDSPKQKPQYLNQVDCENIQNIMNELAHLQGLGLAYNSLGAYASVNHQHWQMFLSPAPYPIEHQDWIHNGGKKTYPLAVKRFSSVLLASDQIQQLQQQNRPFNLLIRPDRTYLIARKIQNDIAPPSWSSGFAWAELAGHFTMSGLSDYQSLSAQQIEQQLRLLRV